MFQALKSAAEAVDAYVATQPYERKFEVGKSYLDDSFYNVLTVENFTEKSVKFKGTCGASRRYKTDQESVSGTYNIHA